MTEITQYHKKWKWAHDRIGRCLGYLQSEADPDRSILSSEVLLSRTSEVWKNVKVCTSAASNCQTAKHHIVSTDCMLRYLSIW